MIEGLKLVGLTGGIGSGKSTVARMIEARGVPVLDADRLARQVVEPGRPAHREIVARWPQVLGADGQIDRKALGALVFADAEARRELEAITHPRIKEETETEARRLHGQGHRLAFYEAALLVETGRYREMDELVVVTAPVEEQLRRVMARDGLSEAQAEARLAAQWPVADKVKVARFVIDNGGDREQTKAQVEAVLAALRADG